MDVGSLSLPVHLLFLWPLDSPSQPSLGTQLYSQWSSHLAKVWCWPPCWRGILNSPAHLPPGPECSSPSPSPWASLWALLHIPGAPSQASSGLCTCCSLPEICSFQVATCPPAPVNPGVGSCVPHTMWLTQQPFRSSFSLVRSSLPPSDLCPVYCLASALERDLLEGRSCVLVMRCFWHTG